MVSAKNLTFTNAKPEMAPSGDDKTPQHSPEKKILSEKIFEERPDEDIRCVLGPWTPDCIQPLASPIPFLICVSLLVLTQSLLVAGYTNSILTTIERRYNLMSSELGIIVSSYDVTCIFTGILVSYFGDSHNRPRWLGRGAFVMAVGSLLFTLPYFLGEKYDPSKYYAGVGLNMSDALYGRNLCNNSMIQNQECSSYKSFNPRWPLFVFMLAKMTLGIGSAPVYILAPTFLYDNVSPKNYSVYAGIMYSMSALGPAVGFFMGAMVLTVYEDPGEAPLGLTTQHTAWVGAWWLGFLINAFLSIMVAIPLMMFPKKLPNVGEEDVTHVPQKPAKIMSLKISIREMPMKVYDLFSNGVWLSVTMVIIMEQSLSSGYVTFIAKYFQLLFAIPASSANVLTGTIIIPGAFMGIMAGGFVMKHIQWDIPKTAKLLLLINVFPIFGVAGMMFLSCNNINLAGITTAYFRYDQGFPDHGAVHIKYKRNLTSMCNTACKCGQSIYEPVCGDDQVTYYSPCHAGCTQLKMHTTHDGLLIRNYSKCNCIYEDFIHTAQAGRCKQECYNLAPFLVLLFITIFTICCGQNPGLVVTLTSVNASLKSFAIGMQYVLVRLFAFIPAPVYFGKIFDSQCLLWTQSCNGKGACLEYNRKLLPFMLFGTGLGLKLLGYAAIICIYITSTNRKKAEDREKMEKPQEVLKEIPPPYDLPLKPKEL